VPEILLGHKTLCLSRESIKLPALWGSSDLSRVHRPRLYRVRQSRKDHHGLRRPGKRPTLMGILFKLRFPERRGAMPVEDETTDAG
jgi:hypothetical protein